MQAKLEGIHRTALTRKHFFFSVLGGRSGQGQEEGTSDPAGVLLRSGYSW